MSKLPPIRDLLADLLMKTHVLRVGTRSLRRLDDLDILHESDRYLSFCNKIRRITDRQR